MRRKMSVQPQEGQEVRLPGAVFGKVYNEYPQYGLTSVEILLRDGQRKIDTGRRFIFKNGTYRADVSSRYHLFANEEAIEIADKVASELGFAQQSLREGRGGNMVFATYISKDLANTLTSQGLHTWVEPSPGDVMSLGFSIRNSIDGSMSFGADLFSFRKICSNGAIVGLQRLGIAPLKRHTGNMNEFVKELKGKLSAFLETNLTNFAQFYKALPQIEVNLEVAKVFAGTLPVKYLPEYIVVERKTKKITLAANGVDAYTAYNDVTEALWHSETVDPKSATTYMTNLHAALEPLVAKVRV
jgi:hypothetical protein